MQWQVLSLTAPGWQCGTICPNHKGLCGPTTLLLRGPNPTGIPRVMTAMVGKAEMLPIGDLDTYTVAHPDEGKL